MGDYKREQECLLRLWRDIGNEDQQYQKENESVSKVEEDNQEDNVS